VTDVSSINSPKSLLQMIELWEEDWFSSDSLFWSFASQMNCSNDSLYIHIVRPKMPQFRELDNEFYPIISRNTNREWWNEFRSLGSFHERRWRGWSEDISKGEEGCIQD
jgi:hypothetical protein